MAKVGDPSTWGTYQQAVRRLAQSRSAGYQGIGYVFSQRDPFCGIDIDGVRDPATGKIAAWAVDLIREINSYTEISVSGTGIHIYIRGSLAQLLADMALDEKNLQHRHPKGVEIYDDRRYFTVSAQHLPGTPTTIEERQLELEQLYFTLFYVETEEEESQSSQREQREEKSSPPARTNGREAADILFSLSDDFIIEQAAKARGGRGTMFTRLMAGDASDFPSTSKDDSKKDDTSRADLALCGILAYWTGCDAGQMDRIFRKSGLYTKSRERQNKWNRYGDRTIRLAISRCTSTYDPTWAANHRYNPPEKRETCVSAKISGKGGN
jgi:primase-polymerase (primpol)-like protein